MTKYYWLNQKSREFLARGYVRENQTAEERIREIAETAEKYLGITGFADKFEDYMSRGWFSLSSPVWANYGLERGLPCSCNGSFIDDTMDSILYKSAEIGMMTKNAAGTSAYFGKLRPRGASISSGGTSSGSVHFMELFDKVANIVSQSNVRRGSMAAYLDIDHPDLEEFLRIRGEGHPIQELSIGVCISNEWMKGLLNKDKDKLKIWGQVIKKRFESGYPYIHFTGNANEQAPAVYKDKGVKIYASNLCVAGDQRVVSDRGLLTAKELYEQGGSLKLFDNQKIVESSEMKLVEKNAEIYEIELENGMTHKITPYHKILTSEYSKTSKSKYGREKNLLKEAKDLKIGDRVSFQNKKGLFGKVEMEKEAFLLGLYQADGTQHKDQVHFCLWENDFDLLETVQSYHDYVCDKYKTQKSDSNNRMYEKPKFVDSNTSFSKVKKKSLISKATKKALNFEKGYVPDWIWTATEKTQWEYIKGLYYADGTVTTSNGVGNPLYLSITNVNKSFIQELQLLLANLGINASIHISANEEERLLPDGKGGSKYYHCKTAYRLVTGNKNDALIFEQNTGFLSRKGVSLKGKYRDNTKKYSKIRKITKLDNEDVYCVTVKSDEHLWICNGFVTHNCNEINLSSDKDTSFVCVLSSINLLHYDEWKDTDAVEVLTYFLDTVTEEYIRKTENMPFMAAAHKFAKEQRAIGLGVLGWHSLLQSKSIAWESMEAKLLNAGVFKLIAEKSLKASREMAEKYGEPDMLKGYGERMVTRLAIAPTVSSSFILGQVSQGIEPQNSNYYVKKLAKGSFTYKNPYLKELLKQKDKDDQEVWKSILENGGSVQHLDFLSDHEKDVFKTFGEISQKEIVIQAAQRQKFVDQGQSLNLMIPPSTSIGEVSKLMIFGWEQGIKGFYYQKSSNPSQLLARSLNECKSCEA